MDIIGVILVFDERSISMDLCYVPCCLIAAMLFRPG